MTKDGNVEFIKDSIKPVLKVLDAVKGKESYLFIGDSKDGKSSLLNYLFGVEYELGRDDRGQDRMRTDAEPHFTTSDDVSSCTDYPKPKCLPGTNKCLVDIPGFQENNGTQKRMLTATATHLLARSQQEVSLVWVISCDKLGPTADSFKNTIDIVAQMLNLPELNKILMEENYPENREALKQALDVLNKISLVFTHNENKRFSLEEIQKNLQAYHDHYKNIDTPDIHEKIRKQVLERIVSCESKIIARINDPKCRDSVFETCLKAKKIDSKRLHFLKINDDTQALVDELNKCAKGYVDLFVKKKGHEKTNDNLISEIREKRKKQEAIRNDIKNLQDKKNKLESDLANKKTEQKLFDKEKVEACKQRLEGAEDELKKLKSKTSLQEVEVLKFKHVQQTYTKNKHLYVKSGIHVLKDPVIHSAVEITNIDKKRCDLLLKKEGKLTMKLASTELQASDCFSAEFMKSENIFNFTSDRKNGYACSFDYPIGENCELIIKLTARECDLPINQKAIRDLEDQIEVYKQDLKTSKKAFSKAGVRPENNDSSSNLDEIQRQIDQKNTTLAELGKIINSLQKQKQDNLDQLQELNRKLNDEEESRYIEGVKYLLGLLNIDNDIKKRFFSCFNSPNRYGFYNNSGQKEQGRKEQQAQHDSSTKATL